MIYGSSRLGSYNGKTDQGKRTLGNKKYELSNHLGNVLAVVSDNKIGIGSNGVADYYEPLVISESDYYPFGMAMKERSFESEEYRFGFNGMEEDRDFGSEITNHGARLLNKALGRWFACDPLEDKYPAISTYAFVANNPIIAVDKDGKEFFIVIVDEGKSYQYSLDGNLIDINGGDIANTKVPTAHKLYIDAINQELDYMGQTKNEKAQKILSILSRPVSSGGGTFQLVYNIENPAPVETNPPNNEFVNLGDIPFMGVYIDPWRTTPWKDENGNVVSQSPAIENGSHEIAHMIEALSYFLLKSDPEGEDVKFLRDLYFEIKRESKNLTKKQIMQNENFAEYYAVYVQNLFAEGLEEEPIKPSYHPNQGDREQHPKATTMIVEDPTTPNQTDGTPIN